MGTSSSSSPFRDHEPADVLRQMPRETPERRPAPAPGAAVARSTEPSGSKPASRSRSAHHLTTVPPLHDLGEPPHSSGSKPKTLPRSRSALLGRYMITVAAIAARSRPYFSIDVLDDLLAPLVLEIDVDVGRLVALAGDEALEEQRCAAQRIDGGHPQAVADAGVGGGAPALTQNFLAARKGDDIVHGQKVRLVTQVRDEGELVLDGAALARGHPLWPAPARAGLRQLAQMAGRCLPGRAPAHADTRSAAPPERRCIAGRWPPSPPAARADTASRVAARSRRYRSPLGYSRLPASPIGTLCRIAVSASCSLRRARTCMWTSPLATSGTREVPRRPSAALASRSRSAPIAKQFDGDPHPVRRSVRLQPARAPRKMAAQATTERDSARARSPPGPRASRRTRPSRRRADHG